MIKYTCSSGYVLYRDPHEIIQQILSLHLLVDVQGTTIRCCAVPKMSIAQLEFPSQLSLAVFLQMLNEARAKQAENRPF